MATIVQRKAKDGSVSWQVKIRRKGYPPVSKTFARKSDAERFARQVEAEMDRGVFQSRDEAESTTLAEALARYELEVSVYKRGYRQESKRIKAWLEHPLARRSLAALRPTDIAKYRDERLAAGCAPSTIRLDLAIISHLYTIAAKEWGIPVANPVRSVSLPTVNNARTRRLEPEEEERLMAALDKSRNPWVKPIVEFALETAMRQGEILSLEWKNVDLERRVARLPITKNGDGRDVPLSPKAVAILRSIPRSLDGRVFPVTVGALQTAWKFAVKRAGIVDLHFHDLRHEATSRLAEILPNVVELSAVTGHKDLRMLKRYHHPKAEDLARKLDRVMVE